jgi:hypothetical protein
MKTILKVIAILLLFVNGSGAVYGGFQMITDPSGSKLQMPLSFLEFSPFEDYLIPGIILFIVNGIFSFVALATIFLETRKYPWFIILQGILLSGWIIIQLLFVRMFYAPLHATFLVIGVCLVGSGLYLANRLKGAPK